MEAMEGSKTSVRELSSLIVKWLPGKQCKEHLYVRLPKIDLFLCAPNILTTLTLNPTIITTRAVLEYLHFMALVKSSSFQSIEQLAERRLCPFFELSTGVDG